MKRKDHGASIFAAALIISLAVHAGFAASWLYSRSGEFGSVDVPTGAISVNLEATDVLDALEAAAAKEAASSPAGGPVTAAASKKPDEIKQEEEERLTKADPDKPVQDKQAALGAQAEAEQLRIAGEGERKMRAQEDAQRYEAGKPAEGSASAQNETGAEAIEKKNREEKRQAAVAGGEETAGAQEAEASAGRVSASQGSILNYGASLRAIISAHAPRDIRKRTLRVSFDIAPAGGLARVDVMKSSGDFAVDSQVIGLVRKLATEFPPPPKGATSSQLSYNIEIIFR